jgi:hypothetical protein
MPPVQPSGRVLGLIREAAGFKQTFLLFTKATETILRSAISSSFHSHVDSFISGLRLTLINQVMRYMPPDEKFRTPAFARRYKYKMYKSAELKRSAFMFTTARIKKKGLKSLTV